MNWVEIVASEPEIVESRCGSRELMAMKGKIALSLWKEQYFGSDLSDFRWFYVLLL